MGREPNDTEGCQISAAKWLHLSSQLSQRTELNRQTVLGTNNAGGQVS